MLALTLFFLVPSGCTFLPACSIYNKLTIIFLDYFHHWFGDLNPKVRTVKDIICRWFPGVRDPHGHGWIIKDSTSPFLCTFSGMAWHCMALWSVHHCSLFYQHYVSSDWNVTTTWKDGYVTIQNVMVPRWWIRLTLMFHWLPVFILFNGISQYLTDELEHLVQTFTSPSG